MICYLGRYKMKIPPLQMPIQRPIEPVKNGNNVFNAVLVEIYVARKLADDLLDCNYKEYTRLRQHSSPCYLAHTQVGRFRAEALVWLVVMGRDFKLRSHGFKSYHHIVNKNFNDLRMDPFIAKCVLQFVNNDIMPFLNL